ncbi:SPL family radical SAM protein [Aquimarina litoralis]|uniref:SPL family radical SAM protein n=1 Tax=Aquimarina litoralis TaxID=584605 RepID=UPI001C5748E7|nr:radical SAM protein [Aquimarina litoralis]MBW1297402.1 radical SAM protein [Aquimarina litoralis]
MPNQIIVKSVLNKTKKRDSWFLDDYTFNPYSSCSFNCLYCYIRGSKYGENLETSLSVKTNAIEVLDKQLALRAKKNQYGIIVLSSATDPYLKIDREYQLTRSALEVILKYKFPVHIITKSNLIKRDFDILKEIDKEAILPNDLKYLNRGTIISFSFSTLRDHIGKIFEPGATPPSLRLKAVTETKEAGFLTGISMMPFIPYITDTSEELEHLFTTFKSAQVDYLLPATLTLYGDQKGDSKTLMLKAIKKHYPELVEKYNKIFLNSYQLPEYYRNAFSKKMKELSILYKINNKIME